MDKLNLTDHSPAAMTRAARPFTDAIVLHRFAADSDKDGITTFDEAIRFFTEDPEGLATVCLPGSYKDKLPTIRKWRESGIPAAFQGKGFVPYHFLVDGEGNAARLLSLDMKGAHAGNYNSHSVAVACLGNFEDEIPSKALLAGCANVIADILKVYESPSKMIAILTHDETLVKSGLPTKGCIGRHFPHELVIKEARRIAKIGKA